MDEIDEGLLELNLQLTPTQRLEAHQQALDLLFELEKAKKLLDEESQ